MRCSNTPLRPSKTNSWPLSLPLLMTQVSPSGLSQVAIESRPAPATSALVKEIGIRVAATPSPSGAGGGSGRGGWLAQAHRASNAIPESAFHQELESAGALRASSGTAFPRRQGLV